jgi:ABC-type nitrate/sulfonate/bicarbonate transport system substrate-binding protein
MRARTWILISVLAILAIAGAVRFFPSTGPADGDVAIRYGITPFQDSALPAVASELGWYKQRGLNVKLVDLGWSDVPVALASGSIDVALYNFDSYQSSWPSLQKGGKDVIFFAPLYVWNGAAIMVHPGPTKLAGDLSKLTPARRAAAVKLVMQQLRGKRIGVTEGTTFEQTVLDALRVAGMDPKRDVQLINARPEDNLAAFLSGDLDAFSGGLTERVQAKRHGAVELLIGPDVSLPVIDGLVARREFAEAHPKEMQALLDAWFQTIAYMSSDIPARSATIRNYLRGKASVDYTANEYAIAWTFQYFPVSRSDAVRSFIDPSGRYFWKPIWQKNSADLISQKKIDEAIPELEFLGGSSLPPR